MPDALIEMRGITKDFPGVRALKAVTITVQRGEVRGIVGENGAGKSTLIKILSGAYLPDRGEIRLEGKKVEYRNPLQALELGIGAIYQELNLIYQLNVAENIMLGQVPSARWGSIDRAAMHGRAQDVLRQLGVELDTHLSVSELNVAQQQVVEIAKALARDLRILIMDEPTAALNNVEIANLFNVIRALKKRGVTILYISHRLKEIFEITDSVSVLKDGTLVDTKQTANVSRDDVVRMMIGRQLTEYYPPKDTVSDESVFEVRNLNLTNNLHNVNLQIRRGEILGVAGLEGQGQREMVRAIIGAIRRDSGEFFRNGRPVRIESPLDAKRAGIGFIPDDRKADGLVLVRSAKENISLASLEARKKGLFFIDEKKERSFVTRLIDSLDIKLAGYRQLVKNLSGGNQQKVVVAKWLGTEPGLLVVAEPTRGIDVGSKSEIHHIMRDLARKGVGILMVSSDLPEILGMSDRILVLSRGRIVAELSADEASEEAVMGAATKDLGVTEVMPAA
jgi:ribose transport system ATP-binding protein